jgi:cysteine desulfurase/selenocysteine lyase
VENLGVANIHAHEDALMTYGTTALQALDEVRIIGTAKEKASVLSFVLKGIHAHDLGTILDQDGIAIRTGHHCAQPVMDFFNVPATARASLGLYNTREDIEALIWGLRKVQEVFR